MEGHDKPRGRVRCLWLEDEPDMFDVFYYHLTHPESYHWDVERVHVRDAAQELLRTESFEVLIVDVMTPNNGDQAKTHMVNLVAGLQILECLSTPEWPGATRLGPARNVDAVVVWTAAIARDVRDKIDALLNTPEPFAGCDRVLEKPVSDAAFREAFGELHRRLRGQQ